MAKIQIKSLESESLMTILDEKETRQILGGYSWHVYHNKDGDVIGREYEDDDDDRVIHHNP
jgi:hypothetical protein